MQRDKDREIELLEFVVTERRNNLKENDIAFKKKRRYTHGVWMGACMLSRRDARRREESEERKRDEERKISVGFSSLHLLLRFLHSLL